jgi:esterase/lipase superfamily enzyme
MELLVFGHAGARVLVFPTRQGRFYDYENWRLVEAIRDCIEAGSLQLFCVDSVDSESLYCEHRPPQGRIERHRQYEAYVVEEVVPFTAGRNADARSRGCWGAPVFQWNILPKIPGIVAVLPLTLPIFE